MEDKDLLKKLFEGNYCPADNVVPCDQKYQDIKNKVHEGWDYFEHKMMGGDRERLKQLQDLIADPRYMENFAFFEEGWKTGKLLSAI